MSDFYLKLTNEADMTTVLSAFYGEEGEFVANTADYSIDAVGVLQEPTGNTLIDDNGVEYPEMVDMQGWHVNIRILSDDAFLNYAVETLNEAHGVTPLLPQRTWL